MRAVGYIRVSTEYQVEKGNSLEAQKDSIREYCNVKGWKLVNIYQDGGLSGGTSERPAYQQMLKDLKKDKFDVIIVTKIDRLSRNIRDFVFFLDLVDRHSKGFVSVTQNFDTSTPMGRLTLNILASFAQFEREILAERVREILFKKALKGDQWLGGVPPMGYKVVDKKLVINEDEVDLVKDIFKTYIVTQSTNQTASILTARGYRYRGKHIAPTTVQRVIENRVYIGDFVWGKRRTINGTLIKRDKKDWIIVPGVLPRIIETDIFLRANQIMNKNKERGIKRSTSMLSGILYCKQCGSKLYKHASRPYIPKNREPKYEKYFYYKCSGIKDHVCTAPPVKEEFLDELIFKTIERLVSDKKIVQNFLNSIPTETQDSKKTERLKAKRKKLKEKLDKLLDLYLDDKITKEVYEEKAGEISPQLEELESEIFVTETSRTYDFNSEFLIQNLQEMEKLKENKEIAAKTLKEIFSSIVVDTSKKEVILLLKSGPKILDMKKTLNLGKVEGWKAYLHI